MMEQVWIRKFGPSKVLSIESKEDESLEKLGPDEVTVEIHYSGINFADIIMRLGFYKDAPPKPFVPGYEFSGVISGVGSNVTDKKIGDKVYGGSVFGGYASEIKIPSWMAVKLPEGISLEEGAALPVAFITANAALFDMGRVRKGDKVLIDCATGGVGTLAMQMLSKVGAETVGLTSSPAKKALIESYGARALTHEEFWNDPSENNYDFILNSQGGSTIQKHYERLGFTGRIVCLGVSSGIRAGKRDFFAIAKAALTMPKFSIIGMFDKNRGVYALNALKLMEDEEYGKKNVESFSKISEMGLRPHIGKVFGYKEVSLAHQFIEERKATGKVLLSWKQ